MHIARRQEQNGRFLFVRSGSAGNLQDVDLRALFGCHQCEAKNPTFNISRKDAPFPHLLQSLLGATLEKERHFLGITTIGLEGGRMPVTTFAWASTINRHLPRQDFAGRILGQNQIQDELPFLLSLPHEVRVSNYTMFNR